MARHSMRLSEVPDREVLALVQDASDGDGQAMTADVAALAGLDTRYPLTNIGIRLGYLKRIGMLGRDPETMGWYLTTLGVRFVRGRLTKAQQNALEALRDEGAAWAATESLSRLLAGAGDTQATMMRRQWQHGWAQRR